MLSEKSVLSSANKQHTGWALDKSLENAQHGSGHSDLVVESSIDGEDL